MEFNPKDFSYNGGFGIDFSFWTSIASEDARGNSFRIPSQRLNVNWPAILREDYEVNNIYYDPRITSLHLEVTHDMVNKKKSKMYVSLSRIDGKTFAPSDSLSPEQWLQSEKMRILGRRSAKSLLHSLGEYAQEEKLIEFEERILQWQRGYGFLVDYGDMKGLLFPVPKDDSALKYEVIREFFFHLPYNSLSGVILSIGEEPNSNKAIWGFRRDMATDWPKEFPDSFINEMNGLTADLEDFLKS